MSGGPSFRLAKPEEAGRVVEFINLHFDWKLPVVNRPEFFDFYYRSGQGLQFALAEQGGEWLAVVGYIRASQGPRPDLWASVWVAKKGANGAGLALMDALPRLAGAGVLACNNIRPKTMALYRFLGWHAGRMGHFYRLAPLPRYQLAQVQAPAILPVGGDLALEPVPGPSALAALGLPETPHTPKKDVWYLARRYFAFPHLAYQVYAARHSGALLAYLVCRVADSGRGKVLRIADYIGRDEVLPRLGKAIDRLLLASGAEYAELYCAGLPAAVLEAAGFCERAEGSADILPNYLTPPLYENTDYYYFTSAPEQFVMFRPDGDQDRPNLPEA